MTIVYRASTLGTALMDSLDDLIREGIISVTLAHRIAELFDQSYTKVVQKEVHKKTSIRGKLHQYNHCDDIWVFRVCDIKFKAETRRDRKLEVTCPKVKIVASKNDSPGAVQ